MNGGRRCAAELNRQAGQKSRLLTGVSTTVIDWLEYRFRAPVSARVRGRAIVLRSGQTVDVAAAVAPEAA
jgi:hypothetical protein